MTAFFKIQLHRIPFFVLPFLIIVGQTLPAQSRLHDLDNISIAPDRTVTLSFEGSVSNLFTLSAPVSSQFMQMFDLYPLDTSDDLVAWTRHAMLQRTNSDGGPLLFQESAASLPNARFYRTPTNYFITPFPAPTGPFPVGTLVRVLTDSTRQATFGVPNRAFMCTVWYPGNPPGAQDLPGAYTDAAVAGDANLYNSFGWDLSWTNVMIHAFTHTVHGLPFVSGTNRFPVILYSHGYICDRTINSYLATELASHGYVVAAVDHFDCHATVFPDARGVVYVPPGTITDPCSLDVSRNLDLNYLAGQLPVMNTNDPVLAGRLDLNRIAAMGWSLGGGTAANVSWIASSSIKCMALLDPFIDSGCNPYLYSHGLQKPFLTMNSTVWAYTNITPSPSTLQAMSSYFFSLATTNAIWFQISNAHHQAFSDFALDTDMTGFSRAQSVAINTAVLWFFDTYLKNQSPEFPTNTEIINLQRK